ncbi:MAG: DUF3520 domain-containing protein [bacterium]|nr:DUF3520 domain-containing protein [bacterium]
MNDFDSMHQKLCAYILGEGSAAERDEVESALASSEELRAEKERLESTIGLVQGALADSEGLSAGAMAEVMCAAGGGASLPSTPPIAWYRAPGLRAAAAVVVMFGGVAAIVTSIGSSGYTDRDVAGSAMDAKAPGVHSLDAGDVLMEEALDFRGSGRVGADEDTFTSAGDPDTGVDMLGKAGLERDAEPRPEDAPQDMSRFALADGAVDAGVPSLAPERYAEPSYTRRRESGGQALARTQVELGTEPRVGGEWTEQMERLQADQGETRTWRYQVDADREHRELNQLGVRSVEKAAEAQDAFGLYAARVPTTVLPGEPVVVDESIRSIMALGLENAPVMAPVGGVGGGGPIGDGVSIRETPAPKLLNDITTAGPSGPATPGPTSPGPVTATRTGGDKGGAKRARKKSSAPVDSLGVPGYGAGEVFEADTLLERAKEEKDVALDFVVASGADDFFLGEDADAARGRWRKDRRLSVDELRLFSDNECERVLRTCRPQPNERPRDMFFRFWGDNAFEIASQDNLSTFAADVDTASYALARRYLNEGNIPEKAQVRTEEFVNYFDPDIPAPAEGTFAIHTELAPSLFGGSERRWLLRVGVRGKVIDQTERKPLALTFVVDTSGSMRENNRLELVKHAMRLLIGELDARDSIAIVTFAKGTQVILPMTSVANRGVIEAAIHPLTPDGSTNAEAGLKLGYEVGLAALDQGAHNRIVFLSDGVANVGQTDQDRINADVKRHSDKGLFLNTIGVGLNNHNDVFLEQLANKGDGICDYIDSAETAKRAIVERFTGALVPIASDVKIQVEFDPAQVTRYRLLGYENRAIADEDFRNDKVDAGEVGSGHQVQALYEIERSGTTSDETPLAKVNLRWKAPKTAGQDPNEVDVTEISGTVSYKDALGTFTSASPGYRRTALVAQFAEFLRRSTHARGDSYESLLHESATLASELSDKDFDEFVTLIKRAYTLNLPAPYFTNDLHRTIDEYRRFQYLRHQLGELERKLEDKELKELRKTNDQLENKLRELIRQDLERKNG